MTRNWDARFMGLARHIAGWSKDPSTRVGAVVVDSNNNIRSVGFNGFPRNVADTWERLADRETKYDLVVHAEMNALCAAARIGVALEGCVLYTSFPPCSGCVKHIAQMGIKEVVFPEGEYPERWLEDIQKALGLFREAGVAYRKVSL
jgi:dCMP deaminase